MKKYRKFLLSILLILIVLFIAGLCSNLIVERKASTLLKEQLPELKFEALQVQVFKNAAELSNIDLNRGEVNIRSEKLKVSGLNYWKFLTQKNIDLNRIEINDPEIVYQTKSDQSKGENSGSSSNSSASNKLNKQISVEEIYLNHGKFALLDSVSREKLRVKNFDFQLKDLKIDSATINHKIPFNFGDFVLGADSVELKVDQRHNLNVAKIEIQNKKSYLKALKLKSIYSKSEFQQHTPIEKDRYNLTVDSIALVDTDFGFRNDSLKFFSSIFLINNADFEIYRDKTQPDDSSIKPMYSEMLRKLAFLLKIDSLNIKNSRIVYEERIKADRKTGKVIFANVNGKITNLTNFSDQPEFPTTSIIANANFMGQAPLKINWGFKVNNPSDWFNISGNMSELSAHEINGFLKPGMNVMAQGTITNMNFNFSGNKNVATGNVNMAYKNFKVEVLKKDGTQKSGMLTTIANIFVKSDGDSGKNVVEDLKVQRDKTKSFWNYLWSCVKKGALKTFI